MIHRTQLAVETVELEIGDPLAFVGVDAVEVIRHAALGAPMSSVGLVP